MNYIDAEKLITTIRVEIERLKRKYGPDSPFWGVGTTYCTLEHILSFLDTLPVEEPKGLHFTPLNRLIQTLAWNKRNNAYAKKLVDCLVHEGYTEDANVLQDYISHMNGYNIPMATMDEQEQSEVDLEKEIEENVKKYIESKSWHIRVDGVIETNEDWKTRPALYNHHIDEYELQDIARYFYELGKNSKRYEIH